MKNWKKMIVTAAALASLALFAGCTAASAVSVDEAKKLVQQTVGAPNAVVVELESDRDDGVYELEVIVDGIGYEYEVDSRTGQIREVEYEGGQPKSAASQPTATQPAATQPAATQPAATQPAATQPAATQPAATQPAATQPAARITLEEAKAIAYAHAGVDEADAWDKSYEQDDGRYEIEFEYDGYDYEYDISYEGEILKSRKDRDDDHHDGHHSGHQTAATQPSASQTPRITAEEALTIALNHAGVTDARDKDVEWDDGRWEVSFDADRIEYAYKISADGTIVHWEKDHDD